jgi:hypothetical protein
MRKNILFYVPEYKNFVFYNILLIIIMPTTEDIVFYIVVGSFVLAFLLLLYKIVMWLLSEPNNITITLQDGSQVAVPADSPEAQAAAQTGRVVPGGQCRPGFTKQGNMCIKQCYEHPSLKELYKRPEKDIANPFAKYGVDDRWGNVNSSTDYCYLCPPGFELGQIDDNDKKMYCTTRCPPGMMNNIQAQTCYKGHLLCPQGESIEACEMRACAPGYTKQTNHLGQVLCVPNGAKCPPGMRDNDEYIGCWKDKKEAVISSVEDLYFLNSSDQDEPLW